MIIDKKKHRQNKELFSLLYETASNAGIEIIEDKINRKGGICRIEHRLVVIYDANAPLHERNRLILDAISQMNPDQVYLPPKVRQILEERKKE